MITLAKVELTRLLWRRAVVVLLVLAAVLAAAVFGLRVHDTRPKSVEDLVSEYGVFIQEEVELCESSATGRGRTELTPEITADCRDRVERQYGNRLDLVDERENGGALAALVFLVMLMLLAGTTFAGHDWNTGSISNQLLFEPRRERVWLAKAVAVGLLTSAAALAVMAAYWSGMWLVASMRDLPIQDHAVGAAYKQAVLGAGIAAVAGTFGYALTMLLRSTVGTLGLLFAVGFVCIVLVAGVLGLDGNSERFMPWGNFYAYAVGSYEIPDYGFCFAEDGYCTEDAQAISRAQSVVYFAVIWLIVAVPSLLSFHRRDLP